MTLQQAADNRQREDCSNFRHGVKGNKRKSAIFIKGQSNTYYAVSVSTYQAPATTVGCGVFNPFRHTRHCTQEGMEYLDAHWIRDGNYMAIIDWNVTAHAIHKFRDERLCSDTMNNNVRLCIHLDYKRCWYDTNTIPGVSNLVPLQNGGLHCILLLWLLGSPPLLYHICCVSVSRRPCRLWRTSL